ncbi:MAG: helix-turn-helix domain-containing protein [Dysgonamonadaceae bacterium]|nr:helix-turn-helix domain-containing protein [Dysgonamonadaceae bacterium]
MHYLYIATIFAGALVCLLASLLLFARSKTGERSRIILAVIVFFSVVNYITRFIDLCRGEVPDVVVSAKMLLVANFMVVSYIMYPIEVISPGWLNFWRIVKLYAIWLLLCFVYIITSWIGLQYAPYSSIPEMFVNVEKFEVWFRLVLCLLMFAPVLFIFYIHRMKQNNNTDWIWLKKYTFTFFVNILAYIMVLVLNNPTLNILYYYISVGCSLYIAYMELFDRLLRKSMVGNYENKINLQEVVITEDEKTSPAFNGFIIEPKNLALVERLHAYMKENSAWRDPDLTLNRLASKLFTNRTTLAQVMRESGYENYTNYINRLRINDFLQQIKSGESTNFQEAFFFVGFRSRSTALRNFRQFTGTTPSEYFKMNIH